MREECRAISASDPLVLCFTVALIFMPAETADAIGTYIYICLYYKLPTLFSSLSYFYCYCINDFYPFFTIQ